MLMGQADKNKATFCFRRMADGSVIGEVIDEAGIVVESKHFGFMSVREFDQVMDFLNRKDRKLAGKLLPTVEFTAN